MCVCDYERHISHYTWPFEPLLIKKKELVQLKEDSCIHIGYIYKKICVDWWLLSSGLNCECVCRVGSHTLDCLEVWELLSVQRCKSTGNTVSKGFLGSEFQTPKQLQFTGREGICK